MNHKDAIKQIARHYGFRHQAIKTAEECSELAAAMNKLVNGEGGRNAVVEEMADVQIMLRQMQYLMRIDHSEISAMVDYKVNRQLGRMKES